MSSPLERLKDLTQEAPDSKEFGRLTAAAAIRLADARNKQLALPSRFDLGYNAVDS